MQFVDVIRSVQRHWRVSLGILLLTVVGLGAFLVTRSEVRDPDRWRGAVQLLVPARDKDGVLPEGVPPSLLQGQGVVALSAETTGQALQAAGLSASDDVAFGFTSNEAGDILTLSATAPTSEEAIRLADSFADSYTEKRSRSVSSGSDDRRTNARGGLEVLEARLASVEADLAAADPALVALVKRSEASAAEGSALDLPDGTALDEVLLAEEHRALVERIDGTRQSYADAAIDALLPQSYSTIVEREIPVQITPELPSPLIPIAVAVGAGLLLAVAVPVILDRLDHTIRDPRVAASALSAPVLSTIPASSPARLTMLASPGSARESAYRKLAAASIATDELPRAIVVTAPVGHMQDSVAANFAAALAGLGLRVALVATDASQSWYADDAQEGTLTLPDYLATAHLGRLNGQLHESLVTTPLDNLRVIPHGVVGADQLLDGLPPLLQALADADIDVTVIAGPAMLEESSTTILAWSTRSVLWVVESGEVTEHEARDAAEQLALAGATPFGVAVVDGAD